MSSAPPSPIEIPKATVEVEDRHLGVDVELPHSPVEAVGSEVKELGKPEKQASSDKQSASVENAEVGDAEEKQEEGVETPAQAEEATLTGEASSAVERTSEDDSKEEDKVEETTEAVKDEDHEPPAAASSSPSESDVEALRERLKLVEQRFSGTSIEFVISSSCQCSRACSRRVYVFQKASVRKAGR